MPSAASTSKATPMLPSKGAATDGSFSTVLSNAKHSTSTDELFHSGRDGNQARSPGLHPEALPFRDHSDSKPEDSTSGTESGLARSDSSGTPSGAASAMEFAATGNSSSLSYLLPNAPVLAANLMQQAIPGSASSGAESVKGNGEADKPGSGKTSSDAQERAEMPQPQSSGLEGISSLYVVIPQQLNQVDATVTATATAGNYPGAGVGASVAHGPRIDPQIARNQLPAVPDVSPSAGSTEKSHKTETTTRDSDSPSSNTELDSSLPSSPSVATVPTSIPVDLASQENGLTSAPISVNENNGPQASRSLQKRNLNVSLSGDATTSSTADSGNGNAPAFSTGVTATASSPISSGASQPVSHVQVSSAEVDATTQKAVGGNAIDGQTVLAHPVAHANDSQQRAPVAASPSALRSDRDESAPDVKEFSSITGVNTAKLAQAVNETEMHVGMHSSEFGDISIRASISQQQMTAQISLDHNDLREAILAHVSSMQAKLGNDYGMQTSIAVHHEGASSSGGSGHSSQQEDRGSNRFARTIKAGSGDEHEANMHAGPLIAVGDGSRLDIQA